MKTKNIKNKITEYFFLNPTARLRVRQIERIVKVPLPSAIRYTKELEKEGILKSTKIAGITVYSADRTSEKFLIEKKLFNIRQLFPLVTLLKSECSAIAVFGSHSKGEDVENSDIDLYLETAAKPDVSKFEKELKKRIHIFRYKKIQDVENKQLANNIMNGIILSGFIEVFK